MRLQRKMESMRNPKLNQYRTYSQSFRYLIRRSPEELKIEKAMSKVMNFTVVFFTRQYFDTLHSENNFPVSSQAILILKKLLMCVEVVSKNILTRLEAQFHLRVTSLILTKIPFLINYVTVKCSLYFTFYR